MTTKLAFGDCRELLAANGFVLAPIGTSGSPLGPWAVTQLDYSRYGAYAESPAAVLTRVPLAMNEFAPVQNASSTWLAVVSVRVRPGLASAVDAIVGRHMGDGKRLAYLDDDVLRIVVRLPADGGGFNDACISTTAIHEDFVRVSVGPDFLPLDGPWQGGDLLTVMRSDLPEVDAQHARLLVDEVDHLLLMHMPPIVVPERPKPRPLPDLAKGERLEFHHAREPLSANGYEPCAIEWAERRVSDKWYRDFMNRVVWLPETAQLGVGLFLDVRGRSDRLAYVEITGTAEQVARADAAVAKCLGAGLLRVSSDGQRLRLFQATVLCDSEHSVVPPAGPGPYVAGRGVRLRVVSAGVLAVSALDNAGACHAWPDGSPLTIKREALPVLDGWNLEWVLGEVQAALAAPVGKAPADARRRKQA